MKTALQQNMGMLDRVLRIFAGILSLVLAALVVTGAAAIILVIVSIPLLIPGLAGYCPSYSVVGITTKRDDAPGIH